MRILLSTTVAAGLAAAVLAGGIASAQTVEPRNAPGAPNADWMSMSEIVAKVEDRGYRVHEVEIDDGLYEVKATDANGMRVEADLDPKTGDPVRDWRRDD